MDIKPIKNEKDYQDVLKRIDEIFDAKNDTPEGDELEILVMLVEKYEAEYYPIEEPDPIELIKFILEQRGMSQKDFSQILGSRHRASELLNKKRSLSLDHIRKIHTALGVPSQALIQEYELRG
jgi:HTH-type transcriptional regulator/antitoxin HigA